MVTFFLSFNRNQGSSNDNLPTEILEILQKIQKSPELQNILAEKLQVESSMPYVIYVPNGEFLELNDDENLKFFF